LKCQALFTNNDPEGFSKIQLKKSKQRRQILLKRRKIFNLVNNESILNELKKKRIVYNTKRLFPLCKIEVKKEK